MEDWQLYFTSVSLGTLFLRSLHFVKIPTRMELASARSLYMASACQMLLNATSRVKARYMDVTQTLEKFRTLTGVRNML